MKIVVEQITTSTGVSDRPFDEFLFPHGHKDVDVRLQIDDEYIVEIRVKTAPLNKLKVEISFVGDFPMTDKIDRILKHIGKVLIELSKRENFERIALPEGKKEVGDGN